MPPWRRNNRNDAPPSAGFRITRIEPQPAAAELPSGETEPAPPDLIAARFGHPARALTFGAAISAEPSRRAVRACREPDGTVWVLVRPRQLADAELARALGGLAYLPDGTVVATAAGRRHPWDALRDLPTVTWLELAGAVIPDRQVSEQQEVLVVTSGPLARWVLDQYRSGDLDLTVATAVLRPVGGQQGADWPAVLVRVHGRGRSVPRSLSQAVAGLPGTFVCRPGDGRLLIDLRLTLPMPDEELVRQVPGGQQWLLAGDSGVWQVTDRGQEVAPPLDASSELRPPQVPLPARRPPDLSTKVTLVPDDRPRSADALLLTDEDLAVLRRLLGGSPAAERAVLVLGPGWHLLADPGHNASDLPVGRALHKAGPGGLYHEVGYRLQPALPPLARAEVFGLDARSLVILVPERALRLSLADAVPVWTLWLAPPVAADTSGTPLSAPAVELLRQADATGARASVADLAAGLPAPGHTALRTEGFALEQQGKLAEAARKYWEAGDPALAARLFEMAAEAAGDQPRAGS